MKIQSTPLSVAGKEAEWLRNLILEILLWSQSIAPISIRCDSAATLTKAYSQMYNAKSRHLGVRHNMIRELIMNGVVSIEFMRSQQNLANHLTKGLPRYLVSKSTKGMGLKSNIVIEGDLVHMYLHFISRMCSDAERQAKGFLLNGLDFKNMQSRCMNKKGTTYVNVKSC
ncbi:hypothetical protein Tco_1445855 [Tanacetum coccineum]